MAVLSTQRWTYLASNIARNGRCTCRTPRYSTSAALRSQNDASALLVNGKSYPRDDYTNVTPTILSKVSRQLHLQPSHPIGILRSLIEAHFSTFKAINTLSPIVTVHQNFDELGFAPDHPGRSLTDSYYLNRKHMLRTHTSAHEVEVFKEGTERWLLTADVYRRDEIDASHYPVFHQMEGAHVVPRANALETFEASNAILEKRLSNANIHITDDTKVGASNPYQDCHDPILAEVATRNLKNSLNSMVLELFGGIANRAGAGEPLQVRWIEAFFPFTSPSYEVEVMFDGKWLELLGCGVVKQATMDRSSVPDKMGWAFGLGLERIAMVLFGIPDIRLFWSTDPRFQQQFSEGQISTFKPYSKNPPCFQDVSFWLPDQSQGFPAFHENDFCEIVRDVAGDLAEETALVDSFTHPKTGKKSMCYRINYRSMDRNITTKEAREYTDQIQLAATKQMGIEVR